MKLYKRLSALALTLILSLSLAVPALGFVCYHFFRWYNSRQSA